jgi:hypothetical protein
MPWRAAEIRVRQRQIICDILLYLQRSFHLREPRWFAGARLGERVGCMQVALERLLSVLDPSGGQVAQW